MPLKSQEVQRQYPNLFERFLDFGGFEDMGMEEKTTKSVNLKSRTSEEIENCFSK
jgi:hypothetical protein